MKKYLIILFIITSCAKQSQKLPGDKVLSNEAKDEEVTKKNPGHGNPHNQPTTNGTGCVLLDFDGHTGNNSLWGNMTYAPSGLNATDQLSVLNRVKSDYSFNSNLKITTGEPEFFTYPINKRQRIVITTSWEWYGYYGGVAYINSFSWYDNTECFVFSSNLGYNAKYIADASSHEAGHTFGLPHQSDYDESCNVINEYSNGKIMGYPYYQNSVWWVSCRANDTLIINRTVNQ